MTQYPAIDHPISKGQPPGRVLPPQEPVSPPKPTKKMGRRILVGVVVIAALLVALYVTATLPRIRQTKRLEDAATAAVNAPPMVSVAKARREPGASERALPGNAQAYREAGMYARTTGYLEKWNVDIGDKVSEGQLVATISAPDLDDQLAQAQANLEQSRATLKLNEANAALADTTLARYRATQQMNAGAVAKLLIDEQQASVLTSQASVKAAEASIRVNEAMVQMYSDLQKFEQIIAPFTGVITARNVDPGALVTADNPSATRELFHIMQIDPLRVFVDVPQTYSTGITVGQNADVFRPEEPSKVFHGKVTRTASALDPNTRTLLTQIDVPNPDAALRPGMYLMAKFFADRAAPAVIIPSAALVTTSDGKMTVPILKSDNIVTYKTVQLGRDYGADIEITSGLTGDETVIIHPGDSLPEGQAVQPVRPKPSDGEESGNASHK
jgi:RND family efflux transporter MFP subunit